MKVGRVAVAGSILCLVLAGCGGCSSKGQSTSKTAPSRRTSTGGAGTNGGATTAPLRAVQPSEEVAPGVVRASAGDVTAVMHASTHSPHVNEAWPVSFIAQRNGKPVKADVRYQYLFAGQVVARRSHYRFTGGFHDVFQWPASAVGYPLTFRAVIGVAGVTLNLDYQVQVSR